jgi:NADP-dependent 3-hydroxy acid dehydrogenase YdfG
VLPVFRRQGRGHLVTTVSTQAVYAATKNAVRTLLERLRQESTDGTPRTTTVSPGFVRTELVDSVDNPEVREQLRRSRDAFAIPSEAVARAIAFAVEQPDDVEIGDITIRPAVQG